MDDASDGQLLIGLKIITAKYLQMFQFRRKKGGVIPIQRVHLSGHLTQLPQFE
jgi:hypothetical protein